MIAENESNGILKALLERYEDITLELLSEAYDRGVAVVQNFIHDIANMLYAGINNIVCITGIKQVVPGGGIERLGAGLLNELMRQGEESGNRFLS